MPSRSPRFSPNERTSAPWSWATAAVPSVEPSSTTSTSHPGNPACSSPSTAGRLPSSFQAGMKTSVSDGAIRRTLDDVVFRSGSGVLEAIGRERRDVDEGFVPEDEVADDLADGRALEEAVATETRRVHEPCDLGGLADEGVVVG